MKLHKPQSMKTKSVNGAKFVSAGVEIAVMLRAR